MYQPTFSVCIPNYNYSNYIGETIQSVLDQTYPHFEIIIADNASTDNSLKVIRSFKDERIKIIENKYNIGFAPNLQKATMYAQNDFINLLSSDDKMKPDALEEYAKIISQNESIKEKIVLFSDTDIIESDSSFKGYISKNLETFFSFHYIDHKFDAAISLNEHNTVQYYNGFEMLKKILPHLQTFAPFLSIVYARKLWQTVEGYQAVRTIGPDKFFNYKLLSLNPCVFYIRKSLFAYRMHGSVNYAAMKKTLKQQIDDYLYTIEFSESFLEHLDITEKILRENYLDRICFHAGMSDLVHGTYKQACRMLFFGLAAYPETAFTRKKFYQLLLLLLTGPFAKPLAKMAKKIIA